MPTHDNTRKEKLDVVYLLTGMGADVAQLTRAYIRGENKGVKKNIHQIITQLQKIHKRI